MAFERGGKRGARGIGLPSFPPRKKQPTYVEVPSLFLADFACQYLGGGMRRAAYQAAEQLKLKGIVAKPAESPYLRSRDAGCVKMKTAHGRAIDEERAKWNEP